MKYSAGGPHHFLRDVAVVFVVGVLFFVLPVELLAYRAQNNFLWKRQHLEANLGSISTLLLGNSFFELSFNNHVLGDSSFNVSQMGRQIYYDVEIARRYIPQMPNLRTVIYPVAVGGLSVGGSDLNSGVEYAKSWHIPCRTFPQNILCHSQLLSGRFCLKNYLPDIRCDSLGYQALSGVWKGEIVAGYDRPTLNHKSAVEGFIIYLTRLARICSENGVRFIAITPPQTNLYVDWTPEANYDDLSRVVQTVQAAYPMEYHDYSRDAEFRNNSLFYDPVHLTHVGATRLAERVAEDFNLSVDHPYIAHEKWLTADLN